MIVDVHSHFVPPTVGRVDAGEPGWPRVVADGDSWSIVADSRVLRRIDETYFLISARLDQLDEIGIDFQIVSALPLYIAAALRGAEGRQRVWCEGYNDALEEVVQLHPSRFQALGLVAARSDREALTLVDDAYKRGFVGIEVGSVFADQRLDIAWYQKIFDAAADRDLFVLIHPSSGATFGSESRPEVEFGIGVPSESARILGELVVAGAIPREAPVVCVPHGAGSFLWLWDRLESICDARGSKLMFPDSLVVDTAGISPANMEFLVQRLGSGAVLFGSDLPGAPMSSIRRNLSHLMGNVEMEDVGWSNAQRLLKIDGINSDRGSEDEPRTMD